MRDIFHDKEAGTNLSDKPDKFFHEQVTGIFGYWLHIEIECSRPFFPPACVDDARSLQGGPPITPVRPSKSPRAPVNRRMSCRADIGFRVICRIGFDNLGFDVYCMDDIEIPAEPGSHSPGSAAQFRDRGGFGHAVTPPHPGKKK
jgi:hypothetical protein